MLLLLLLLFLPLLSLLSLFVVVVVVAADVVAGVLLSVPPILRMYSLIFNQ